MNSVDKLHQRLNNAVAFTAVSLWAYVLVRFCWG
jgi:hypothetical protein